MPRSWTLDRKAAGYYMKAHRTNSNKFAVFAAKKGIFMGKNRGFRDKHSKLVYKNTLQTAN